MVGGGASVRTTALRWMALARAGQRLCPLAAPPPPGLLRLGLPSARLGDVTQAARQGGPGEALTWLVKRGHLAEDAAQRRAAAPLDAAWGAARVHAAELPGWLRRRAAWVAECEHLRTEHARRQREREAERSGKEARGAPQAGEPPAEAAEPLRLPLEPPRPVLLSGGCYLWGEVGRGKTLMMDLLALSLPQGAAGAPEELGSPTARRTHFHSFMHGVHSRLHALRAEGAQRGLGTAVADAAAGYPAVLCFDEFQITTIADATLLTPLFQESEKARMHLASVNELCVPSV